MKGKKVVIVANAAFTILNFRRELIETLVNRGSKVLVACPPSCSLMSGRDLEGEFSDLGVDFTPVDMMRNGTNPIKDIGYLRRLYSLFKAEEPDYVLNYTIKPAIYSSIAARMAGVSVICSNITGIGYAMTSSSVKGRLLSFVVSSLYRTALRFNKRVFFQNPDDREVFVNKGLLNKDDTVILNGSGINTESFKRHSDIPSNCSFIFVGRLLRDKGIFEYIAAAEKLKEINPAIRSSIAGQIDDNPESLSQSELDNLCEKGVVDYLGAVSDVRPYLEQHQVLVLPSYREGTPRSVLEAMSMSMPIVTTDAPGCRETVINGENGYLAKVKDSESLYLCMKSFFDHQDTVKSMGLKSRQLAEEKYDVKQVNEKILSTLTD